jgi:hypothetical protein
MTGIQLVNFAISALQVASRTVGQYVQSTNNKAHSYGIEGAVRWKF